MKTSIKSHYSFKILIVLLLCIFQSNTFKMGGFQLLMTSEQQKKIQRIMAYLETDHSLLHEEVNGILYLNGERRRNVVLTDAQKSNVASLSKKLAVDFDELNTSFRSVYFVYGKDDSYKKYFDPLIEFRRSLNNSANDIDKNYLNNLYAQSEKAEERMDLIKGYVAKAALENQEKIDARIKEMSIWQWLFGY